jgi:hypothetical protein
MAVDTDLNVTYMNAAGRNFLGKSWEIIGGKSCYDLFRSSHCNTPDCSMLHAIETGEDVLPGIWLSWEAEPYILNILPCRSKMIVFAPVKPV